MNNQYNAIFIDDQQMEAELVEIILEEENIPLNAAFFTSGNDALSHIQELASDNMPHCIFVDVNMPMMNGFEFVETYNDKLPEEDRSSTPIYFLTSSTNENDKQRALNLDNVRGYFNKPFSAEIFEQVLPHLSELSKMN